MSKFYTSRGDQGETDHIGKGRLSKSHIRIRTVGSLDEASAALGFARAQAANPRINQLLKTTQKDLYRIMAIVAQDKPDPGRIPDLEAARISWLEEQIELIGTETDIPKEFILPGENIPSGAIGLARTVVRRAERDLVALDEAELLYSDTAISYLNRLSSLCFILELFTAQNPPADPGNPS